MAYYDIVTPSPPVTFTKKHGYYFSEDTVRYDNEVRGELTSSRKILNITTIAIFGIANFFSPFFGGRTSTPGARKQVADVHVIVPKVTPDGVASALKGGERREHVSSTPPVRFLSKDFTHTHTQVGQRRQWVTPSGHTLPAPPWLRASLLWICERNTLCESPPRRRACESTPLKVQGVTKKPKQ